MSQHNSDHAQDLTEAPSDPALRVKALESLLVAFHLTDLLVEKDALDAQERHEHRRQTERSFAIFRRLRDPVFEGRHVEAAKRHADRRQLL